MKCDNVTNDKTRSGVSYCQLSALVCIPEACSSRFKTSKLCEEGQSVMSSAKSLEPRDSVRVLLVEEPSSELWPGC